MLRAGSVNLNLPKLSPAQRDLIKHFIVPVFWGTDDDLKVLQLMRELLPHLDAGVHFADNCLTWGRNNSFADDAEFMKAWDVNSANDPSDRAIIWRRYILACNAYNCMQLEGDFVECGCYRGSGVKTVVDYLGGTAFPKTFWASLYSFSLTFGCQPVGEIFFTKFQKSNCEISP